MSSSDGCTLGRLVLTARCGRTISEEFCGSSSGLDPTGRSSKSDASSSAIVEESVTFPLKAL